MRSRSLSRVRATASFRSALLAAVLAAAVLAPRTASAALPDACPADPVAEMQGIQAQMDALLLEAKDIKKNGKAQAKEALSAGPSEASLKVAEIEERLTQIDELAYQLLFAALTINRCCFRSGKYIVWIEIERLLIILKKTYFLIIKIQRVIIIQLTKIKIKVSRITTNVNCCECDGVAPPIAGCASTANLRQDQCEIACLPFNWTGGYFQSSMCDSATGNCVPDP
jgi:hypothetical protein